MKGGMRECLCAVGQFRTGRLAPVDGDVGTTIGRLAIGAVYPIIRRFLTLRTRKSMDYALLAATALGAIGLYLMLPRERAPLVRLGGLLGALAFAGLCLFLVRVASQGLGGSNERSPG